MNEKIPAYTLLPQKALQLAAELMKRGDDEGREPNEWENLSVEGHLDHALHHIVQYLQGKRDEQHLVNASCRILMASEKENEPIIVLPFSAGSTAASESWTGQNGPTDKVKS